MISHKHLRTAIEDYCLSESKELLVRVKNELRYSHLYIPSRIEDGKRVFDIYGEGSLKLTPLFTDLEELEMFYGEEDIEAFSSSFELYRNVLKTTDIEGYVLNPASEKYILEKDLILSITDIPKTTYVSTDPYSQHELRQMVESKNPELEKFLAEKRHVGNYEGLFDMMSSSDMLALMISHDDLSSFFKNGTLDMRLSGPVASMYTDEVGGSYAALFSSRQKMAEVKTQGYKYVQVINLSMLVNFVLTQDMDGIVLNPSTDDVLIPRQMLLSYSLGFERFADDERLSESMYYIFNHDNF